MIKEIIDNDSQNTKKGYCMKSKTPVVLHMEEKIYYYTLESSRNYIYYIGYTQTEKLLITCLQLLTFTASYLQFINVYSSICSGIMSGIVDIIHSIHSLSLQHANWQDYKQLALALQQEKFNYMTHLSIYTDDYKRDERLQQRIYDLICTFHINQATVSTPVLSVLTYGQYIYKLRSLNDKLCGHYKNFFS